MNALSAITLVLAQAGEIDPKKTSEATWRIMVLMGVIIGLFGVVMVFILIYRSRVMKEETSPPPEGLTLSDVRRMHRTGEIDEQEFNRLKSIVTEQVMQRIDEQPPAEDEKEPS